MNENENTQTQKCLSTSSSVVKVGTQCVTKLSMEILQYFFLVVILVMEIK